MLTVTVTDNLGDVAARCRRAGDAALSSIDLGMAEAGETIAETAREIASEHSDRIPGTVRSRALTGVAVVEGGSDEVPTGVLLELGNRGSRASATTFRHPVFGSGTWVEQPKHPYLRPALRANRTRLRRRAEEHLARALRSQGFEVT